MKKIVVSMGVIFVILFIALLSMPQLLYIFPVTQKLALKMEGGQAAKFYFKNTSRDTLYMKGVIHSGTLDEIKQILSKNSKITTLVMEEIPGSIDDEINLVASRELKKHSINTYVPKNGWVASGGTDMFLAGTQRNIHPSARLGVHSWASEDGVARNYPKEHKEHKKYLTYYKEMGIPKEFYWYTLKAAPADSIHWMKSVEIHRYKITTPSLELDNMSLIQKKLASDEFAGRGTENNDKAQELIRNYFQEIQLQSFAKNYNSPFTFKDLKSKKERKGNNIIGYIKGTVYPEEFIVLGAHYDHIGVINDTIYNGADDNASGTAALLTLAKYFSEKPPKHSIIFAAFDAEELGLWGSKHFIDNSPIPLKKIKMNFNFDMISRNPKNEIYVVGTHPFPQFKPITDSIAKFTSLKVLYGHDNIDDKTKDYWMLSSDNAPFFHKGIPTLTFSEEDHSGYHKPSDDIEFVNPEFYKNVVIFIQKTIENTDQNFKNLDVFKKTIN